MENKDKDLVKLERMFNKFIGDIRKLKAKQQDLLKQTLKKIDDRKIANLKKSINLK